MLLEVEQKFIPRTAIHLESKLRGLGFIQRGPPVTIVDWYFDTPDNYLSVHDNWLRFREKGGKSQWELKRGRGDHLATTVYEEIEGDMACSEAVALLPPRTIPLTASTEVSSIDGYAIPTLPLQDKMGLAPFCRIESARSSWHLTQSEDGRYDGLSVDLDTTTTGHAVGEVEAMCEEDKVEEGKKRVQTLIDELTGGVREDSGPILGKMAHFLKMNRPDHYAACLASGSIRK